MFRLCRLRNTADDIAKGTTLLTVVPARSVVEEDITEIKMVALCPYYILLDCEKLSASGANDTRSNRPTL